MINDKRGIELGFKMKILFFAIFFILVKNLSFSQSRPEFALGIYWPPVLHSSAFDTANLDPKDIASFSRVAECYFNLIIDGMQFFPTNGSVKGYQIKDYYLAVTQKVNLKVMLSDVYIATFSDPDVAIFKKNELINRYSTVIKPALRKNIYAIYLGDEPRNSQHLDIVKKWAEFFKANYSDKPTFINLLPRYAFKTDTEYEKYLGEYSKADPYSSIIAFDYYPFRVGYFGPFFLESYFYNLRQLKIKFKDRALWATVHTAKGDGNIANPNEGQLRFMAFSPIAYGAKGLSYWPYQIYKSVTYLKTSIENDIYKYSNIQNINHYIKDVVGPVVMNYILIATLHQSNTSLNTEYPFNENELVKNYKGVVKSTNSDDVLLGIFGSGNSAVAINAPYFIWLVNKNSKRFLANLIITLNGNYANRIQLSSSVIGYHTSKKIGYTMAPKTLYDKRKNETYIEVPQMHPGEGRMIKVLGLR